MIMILERGTFGYHSARKADTANFLVQGRRSVYLALLIASKVVSVSYRYTVLSAVSYRYQVQKVSIAHQYLRPHWKKP